MLTDGLTNPRPWRRRCRAGYSNTGGPPLPRKRAPFTKKYRCAEYLTYYIFEHNSQPFKAERVKKNPSLVCRDKKNIFQFFVVFCFLCTVNRIYEYLNMFYIVRSGKTLMNEVYVKEVR